MPSQECQKLDDLKRWHRHDACPLIFDIGCHIGQDSDFYLRKGFKVVGVEANPSLCAQLKRRFSQQIEDGNFVLIEKAIAEGAGEVAFFLNRKSSIWGTIKSEVAQRNAAKGIDSDKIVVPSIPFAWLMRRFGVPYYLKVDIEGADLLCLEGLLDFRERPQFVSIESMQGSWLKLRAELELLCKLGYTKFQIVDQSDVPKQIPPNPAREGAYLEHRFELGATGLFGRELRGAWVTRNQALAEYSRIYLRNKLVGLSKRVPLLDRFGYQGHGSWYDTHAAL